MPSALSLGTTHLSLYQLTIEPGTRFASMVARRDFEPLDPDAAAALYELTDAMTSAAGLPAYEISNHARPGQESRHNLTYWRYGDYAGRRPGRARPPARDADACGIASPRISCPHLPAMVMASAKKPRSPQREAADEALVMGLRLSEGIDAAAVADRFGLPAIVDWGRVERLVRSGHLCREGDEIRPDGPGPAVARPYPGRDCCDRT